MLFFSSSLCCPQTSSLVIYHFLWNKYLPFKCSSSLLNSYPHYEMLSKADLLELLPRAQFLPKVWPALRADLQLGQSERELYFTYWAAKLTLDVDLEIHPACRSTFYLRCRWIIYSWKHEGPSSVPECCMQAASGLCVNVAEVGIQPKSCGSGEANNTGKIEDFWRDHVLILSLFFNCRKLKGTIPGNNIFPF